MSAKAVPLLIEWSPGRVRVLDPVTRSMTQSGTIGECLPPDSSGRSAIVAVSRRSAFIRSLYVPKANRVETDKVIAFQVGTLLPLNPGECAIGYRLGAEEAGKGRLAIIGAIKSGSLRKIYTEADAAGIRITAVVPLAFASWLAAKERQVSDCAVVETDESTLAVEVIHGGELRYSRSIPRPQSREEVADEISRTFAIAGLEDSPVLSVEADGRDSLEYLASPGVIERLLFSFRSPEAAEAQIARQNRWRARRAVATAMAAVIVGGFAYIVQNPAEPKPTTDPKLGAAALAKANKRLDSANVRLASAEKANRILDAAFKPGQTAADVLTVLSTAASANSWFTDVVVGRGMPVNILGIAMSDRDVADFLAHVSHDPRFEDMKVASIQKVAIGKKPVTQFRMTGRPVGMLAFNHSPKVGRKGT